MSCILRTRERYGITYLTDILLGSKSERIIENGHNRLSTWGIGKELSKSSWIELCNKLVEEGYLFKSDDYGVLYVTATGRDALNSREQILLSITFDTKVRQKKTVIRHQALSIADKGGERIAENLRAWRRKTADEMNVPPYVIFGDKTLFDISAKKPQTISELCECYGIGEAKAERFGTYILQVVEDSCQP